MNKEVRLERTEVADSAFDFLLSRLQSEIAELCERFEKICDQINELREKENG